MISLTKQSFPVVTLATCTKKITIVNFRRMLRHEMRTLELSLAMRQQIEVIAFFVLLQPCEVKSNDLIL